MHRFVLFLLLAGGLMAQSANDELVNVKDLIPDIVIDIRYNGTHNFTDQKLYSTDECFYSIGGIKQLQKIQDELADISEHNSIQRPEGLGLKIFDAYRPHTVQYLMYDIVGPPYVANPANGSNHNKGSAVDLTIIDKATGEELDMGTDFDFFGPEAGHNYTGHSDEVNSNRALLKNLMLKYNFELYSVEWWHYSYVPAKSYPLLDFQMK